MSDDIGKDEMRGYIWIVAILSLAACFCMVQLRGCETDQAMFYRSETYRLKDRIDELEKQKTVGERIEK